MLPRAKKSYGQNWLVDETVVKKIIQASDIKSNDLVLEIGPGTGVLTQALVDAGAQVVAVETDPSLIEPLRQRFGGRIQLIEDDVLTFPVHRFFHHFSYKLIANIPYNITSDLLRHFLTQKPKPSRMILMVQKEVGERITAKPPHMSILAISVQIYGQPKIIAKVSKKHFSPQPQVDSVVVLIDHISDFPYPNEKKIFKIVKTGFSHKRKLLLNNLKQTLNLNTECLDKYFEVCRIPKKSRAENLSLENWQCLAEQSSLF